MERYLLHFSEYMQKEKAKSDNTRLAYQRDLSDFGRFLKKKDILDVEDINNTEVVAYLLKLKKDGKAVATINRRLASLRAFFDYLSAKGFIYHNPAEGIKSPRVERKSIEYLTVSEVELLLSLPDNTVRGVRDRALLELLYASGMRVSEIAGANMADLNLRIGFIISGEDYGKARIIPLGRPARAALEAYCYDARSKLIRERPEEQKALFVNYNGQRLTRQGIWKLIKEYGKKCDLAEKLTPQTLRNSFAVHMIQNGADLKSLQELLGHEDLTATQIFLGVTKNRIKDVYDKTHPRA